MKLGISSQMLCLAVLATAPMTTLWGQSSTPAVLSVEDVVALARSANPQVTGARANQRQATADVQAAHASLFPQIGGTEVFTESTDPVFAFGARLRQGRFTAADFSPSFLNSPGPTSDYTSTLGATWMIFNSGRTVHEIRGARTALTASEQQTQATAQSVAFAAIRAYYRALLADDEKTATTAAVERAQAFAKEAHDRVETGLALVADAMQADVEVSMRQEDAAQAESNAVLAHSELAGVLGDPSKTFSLVVPAGTPGPLSEQLPELQAEAVQKRPDLLALRNRLGAAGEQLKASRAAYGPQVSTFANVQADNTHPFGGGATNWTVGGKIELQLFDGGSRHAAISKSSAESLAADAAYKQSETEAILDVQRAFYALQTAERQYAISGEMLEKTGETLQTARDRYSAGLVTVTEVLRGQEQLRDMEINRTQALHLWWIADAQLRLATGNQMVDTAGVKR